MSYRHFHPTAAAGVAIETRNPRHGAPRSRYDEPATRTLVLGVHEVISYGRGEDAGFVTVRAYDQNYKPRTLTVLAEDVFVHPSPLQAQGAAARWHHTHVDA
jgi:hypothetical protein